MAVIILIFFLACLVVFLCHYSVWILPKSLLHARVLMYHSVDDNSKASGMNIGIKKFEQHVKYFIKHGFKMKKISEILVENDKKMLAITFDDGFKNNYDAFKILEKYRVPCTVYLAPNIENIAFLTNSQIDEMSKSGLVEFGSHTLNHVNLTAIFEDDAMRELVESKRFIEENLGVKCENFAYPFGRFDEKCMELVKKAGYKSAVTTKKRVFNKKKDSFFAIPRISISGKMNIFQLAVALSVGRYKV